MDKFLDEQNIFNYMLAGKDSQPITVRMHEGAVAYAGAIVAGKQWPFRHWHDIARCGFMYMLKYIDDHEPQHSDLFVEVRELIEAEEREAQRKRILEYADKCKNELQQLDKNSPDDLEVARQLTLKMREYINHIPKQHRRHVQGVIDAYGYKDAKH